MCYKDEYKIFNCVKSRDCETVRFVCQERIIRRVEKRLDGPHQSRWLPLLVFARKILDGRNFSWGLGWKMEEKRLLCQRMTLINS